MRTAIIATTLALAVTGCSTQRHSTAQSATLDSRRALIEIRDSITLVATAIIDSPEIVLESPTLSGGRAIVRGRRLKADINCNSGSQTDITTFHEHTVAVSSKTDKQRSAPTLPGNFRSIIFVATAIIFYFLGRKNGRKT